MRCAKCDHIGQTNRVYYGGKGSIIEMFPHASNNSQLLQYLPFLVRAKGMRLYECMHIINRVGGGVWEKVAG